MPPDILMGWIFLGLGIVISLFAACTESAYINVSVSRILKNEATGDPRWKQIKKLKEGAEQVFGSIMVINILGNVMVSTFSAKLLVRYAGINHEDPSYPLLLGVGGVVMSVLTFLFLELIPKMYGTYHFEPTLLKVTPTLAKLVAIMKYPLAPFIALPKLLMGKNSENVFHGQSLVSEEDLIEMMEMGHREGSFRREDVKVLRNIFESSEVEAEDIMTPRINMKVVSASDPLEKALNSFKSHGVSRIPVFEDGIDNLTGILFAKDLLRHNQLDLTKPVRHYMRKGIYLIPETKKVLDLLAEFRNRNLQMAVVVDEYGGTVGLLTLEDVMEEIVGEIFDEHDVVKPQLVKLPGGEIRYQATYPLERFAETCSLVNPEDLEDYETLGGWLSGRIGHLPSPGEEWREGDYRFVVESVQRQRIQRLLMIKSSK